MNTSHDDSIRPSRNQNFSKEGYKNSENKEVDTHLIFIKCIEEREIGRGEASLFSNRVEPYKTCTETILTLQETPSATCRNFMRPYGVSLLSPMYLICQQYFSPITENALPIWLTR